jgi:hypothetical protein
LFYRSRSVFPRRILHHLVKNELALGGIGKLFGGDATCFEA